ncbi:MAG: hypothetical protein WBO10_00095 [Pyrinomonadaceae bacterium]
MRHGFGGALIGVLAALLMQGCFVATVRHDPQKAVDVAEAFARAAFVEKDFEGSLAFTNKQKIVLKGREWETVVRNVQGSAPFPSAIRAEAYETPFGQDQVIVDLHGTGDDKPSYYRVLLVEDATAGYTVVDARRSDTPFPKGPLQESIN